MAIYRLSAKSISRGKGQSAIASAAYRSAEKLKSNILNKEFDYTRKEKVSYTEIILPKDANDKFKDRETLWNEIEKIEKRKDSELAKEYQIAIPNELNKEQSIELIKGFVQKQFVANGLACDVCFHNLEDENPHVHIMTTTRQLNNDGFSTKKDRSIKDISYLINLRQSWEKEANQYLESKGFEEQINAKSYKNMGLDIDGISTDLRGKEGQLDTEYQKSINSKKLLDNPSQIAIVLTDKKAIFNDYDIDRFLNRHALDEDRNSILEGLLDSNQLVIFGKDAYSSVDYVSKERNLIQFAKELYVKKFSLVNELIVSSISKEFTLTDQQNAALKYCVDNHSSIKNIEGYAGSGKSYTISAIREAYERTGHKSLGLALSGIVADSLNKDAKIEQSLTMASFFHNYDKGNVSVDNKTVIFVDEASLIGVRDYSKLLDIVFKENAKIINIGDDNQLQAIQAGGASELIKKHSNSIQLNEIYRQQSPLDKEATLNLSNGKVQDALTHYQNNASILTHNTKEELIASIVNRELENISLNKQSIILAQKKMVTREINQILHNSLKEKGLIDQEGYKFNGKEYNKGDRCIFLKNDYSLNVRNGMLGKIESMDDKGEMVVQLDTGRHVAFNANEYNDFDYGYAITLHKAQGITVDQSQIYLDKTADRHLALVGLTRHRENTILHTLEYSSQNHLGFKGFDELVKVCSRDRSKETIQNYTDTLAAQINLGERKQHLLNQKELIDDVQGKSLKFEETKISYIKSYDQLPELRDKINHAQKTKNFYSELADEAKSYISEQNILRKEMEDRFNYEQTKIEKSLERGKGKKLGGFEIGF